MEFYVSAGPGTEAVLRDELCELGFKSARLNSGGIPFSGKWEDGWRACLQTRIGQRVMVVLGRFAAPDLEGVYDSVAEVTWSEYLTPRHTFAVSAYAHESTRTNPNIVALKAKDAIVDQLRHEFGERPNVDREDPDVRVFVYWARQKATVYLDMSGEPLFKRGYRSLGGEAPLKETLAAAMLRLAGWDREMPLVDPMCGFERWANFNDAAAERMRLLRGEMRRIAHGKLPRVTGFDIDDSALSAAEANAKAAGLRLSFRKMPLRELQPDNTRRMMVANPPYGIRLDADNALYQELGAAVQRLRGWRIAILAGSPRCVQCIKQTPVETYPLKNGAIDCRLMIYEP